MARDVASYLRHIPPAPLKVGIPANHGLAGDVQSPKRSLPEAADKPAPTTAMMFLEERRSSWKALMSLDGAIWYVCMGSSGTIDLDTYNFLHNYDLI